MVVQTRKYKMEDRKAYSFICDDGFATKAFFSEELATLDNLREYGSKILAKRRQATKVDIYDQHMFVSSVGIINE